VNKRTLTLLIPLAVFLVLVGFFVRGLWLDPRDVPSPLIDKPAPVFRLPVLSNPQAQFGPVEMRGKVWLLNVWASWCVSCRAEHPVLVELSRHNVVPIYGLDYKDKSGDAADWLARFGNPYVLSATDLDGQVGIDYGVYGVPETYVIDKQGIIRKKHTGPISPEDLEREILPLVRKLSQG
jgi:cytochrome c biogenesis protein CcmG, thiol:disulfide interchange protein DsbE